MASLYNDANWSNNDLNGAMESVKKEVSKGVFSVYSIEQLRHYKEKMEERAKEGRHVSIVDMFGLSIEYLIQGKVHKTLHCTDVKYILKIIIPDLSVRNFIINYFLPQKKMGTLSDQQMALTMGQNPLPIYTALNMKNGKTGSIIETGKYGIHFGWFNFPATFSPAR